VRATGRGVQGRAESPGSHLNPIPNSGPRKIPCLSFLISEMGRVILASNLSYPKGIIISLIHIWGQRKIKEKESNYVPSEENKLDSENSC